MKPNQEDVLIENEAATFPKDTEGETPLSVEQDAAVDLLERSSSIGSNFVGDTEKNPREINGDDGVVGPSNGTEKNENTCREVRAHESQMENEDEVTNQPKAVNDNCDSETVKADEGESKPWTSSEAAFEPNHTEVKDDSSYPMEEIKVIFNILYTQTQNASQVPITKHFQKHSYNTSWFPNSFLFL